MARTWVRITACLCAAAASACHVSTWSAVPVPLPPADEVTLRVPRPPRADGEARFEEVRLAHPALEGDSVIVARLLETEGIRVPGEQNRRIRLQGALLRTERRLDRVRTAALVAAVTVGVVLPVAIFSRWRGLPPRGSVEGPLSR